MGKIDGSKPLLLSRLAASNEIISCEYTYYELRSYNTNQVYCNRGGGDREAKPPLFL